MNTPVRTTRRGVLGLAEMRRMLAEKRAGRLRGKGLAGSPGRQVVSRRRTVHNDTSRRIACHRWWGGHGPCRCHRRTRLFAGRAGGKGLCSLPPVLSARTAGAGLSRLGTVNAVDTALALSPAQERLWFAQAISPDVAQAISPDAPNNGSASWWIDDEVDRAAFASAIGMAVAEARTLLVNFFRSR